MGSKRKKEYLPCDNPKYKVYHETFDRLRLQSNILNQNRNSVNTSMLDFSKASLNTQLLIRQGNENRTYFKEGEEYYCTLLFIEKRIPKLEHRFKNICQTQVNSGKRRLVIWPQDLLNEKLILEAEYDVTLEEIEVLEQMINKYIEQENKEDDAGVLKNGLIGSGRLRNGILVEVDGQKVKLIDGILVITSKSSPYYGMETPDYYDLVKAYNQAKNLIDHENRILTSKLKIKGLERSEFAIQWQTRKQEIFEAHPEFNDLFGLSFKGRQVPCFPKHLQAKEIEA